MFYNWNTPRYSLYILYTVYHFIQFIQIRVFPADHVIVMSHVGYGRSRESREHVEVS